MEKCQRCGEECHDMRTLWMACFYNMGELNIPFEIVKADFHNFFTLRTCKECRADWLKAIQTWFDDPNRMAKEKFYDNPERCIPVREKGSTVWLTRKQYEKRFGKDPLYNALFPEEGKDTFLKKYGQTQKLDKEQDDGR